MDCNERINSISHLVGAALALLGMVLLIVKATWSGDVWKVASALAYGCSLFLLFLFSTLFHGLRGVSKEVFRRFDHIGIYLLIAGTYTPYCLVVLRETRGWLIFGIVWGVAVAGTIFKAIVGSRFNQLSTILYVAAGWTILVDFGSAYQHLPAPGFWLLLGGGVLYTAGAVFYALEKLPYNHEIWHFFVLAAAACHFFSIFSYVL